MSSEFQPGFLNPTVIDGIWNEKAHTSRPGGMMSP